MIFSRYGCTLFEGIDPLEMTAFPQAGRIRQAGGMGFGQRKNPGFQEGFPASPAPMEGQGI